MSWRQKAGGKSQSLVIIKTFTDIPPLPECPHVIAAPWLPRIINIQYIERARENHYFHLVLRCWSDNCHLSGVILTWCDNAFTYTLFNHLYRTCYNALSWRYQCVSCDCLQSDFLLFSDHHFHFRFTNTECTNGCSFSGTISWKWVWSLCELQFELPIAVWESNFASEFLKRKNIFLN